MTWSNLWDEKAPNLLLHFDRSRGSHNFILNIPSPSPVHTGTNNPANTLKSRCCHVLIKKLKPTTLGPTALTKPTRQSASPRTDHRYGGIHQPRGCPLSLWAGIASPRNQSFPCANLSSERLCKHPWNLCHWRLLYSTPPQSFPHTLFATPSTPNTHPPFDMLFSPSLTNSGAKANAPQQPPQYRKLRMRAPPGLFKWFLHKNRYVWRQEKQ